MNDDAAFEELTVEMEQTIVVAFTQRGNEATPDIDLAGTTDYDTAIAIAVKGVFMLIMDSMGFYEMDETDPEEDDT